LCSTELQAGCGWSCMKGCIEGPPLPAAVVGRGRAQRLLANIHPNNREGVAESGCLWQSCTERTRCHISPAVSHQRRRHSLIPLHCLQLNQYQRQLPRLSPHVPPLIQLQHPPERLVRCQRQRYQLQHHSPPGRGIGILSLAARKFGSTDRLLGKCRKTCAGRALPRTRERLDRYRRIPQT
jgi:hypothetical protein